MQIKEQYAGYVIGGIVSTVMSFFMSFFVTFINLGLSEYFVSQWAKAFCSAWPLAFILAVTITPIVRRWVDKRIV